VAHLPQEGVTVLAQKTAPSGQDQGWATWTQRGELLWRGQMEDSQGRTYNIRILPGYVAPWQHGVEGWSDAASNLGEYGEADTWTHLGRNARSCFRWGWKDAFWEFGLQGSGTAWSEHFAAAKGRVARRTFGWPLAYPWALISSTFETLLRVPLGTAGAAIGTVSGAVLVPAGHIVWPTVKAAYHVGIDGALLPVSGWAWQTLAAPPASIFASAPTPPRADGVWMKVVEPRPSQEAPPAAARPELPEGAMDSLTHYAQEAARLNALETQAQRQEQEELSELRARHAQAHKTLREARILQLQAWAEAPEHQRALQDLVKEGGDPASIRGARPELVKRLVASGLSQEEAEAAVAALIHHPLRHNPPPAASAKKDKTDPLRGALETTERVTGLPVAPK